MKAVVICPFERPNVAPLSHDTPLAALSIFGKPLLVYWLEHLLRKGARQIFVLAADRPDQIRQITGDGQRWGLNIEVIPEARELTPSEARDKYEVRGSEWLSEPNAVNLIDGLPGGAPGLFDSYAGFIDGLRQWMAFAKDGARIGLREIQPGIWAGLHSRISPRAILRAPCWIGENVAIAPEAVIGPMAVIENNNLVEQAAEISESYIGPETFVGSLTRIHGSIAFGNHLINWRTDSSVRVPDAFLLCSLKERRPRWHRSHLLGRAAAALLLGVSAPLIGVSFLKSYLTGQRLMRARRAVLPGAHEEAEPATTLYYEFCSPLTLWRRWPQLWNIVNGEFSWVGNRPLNSYEAAKLATDFERLWLAAPVGFISQADAEGCAERFSDAARAHAAFYSVQSNWRLDLSILVRGLIRLVMPVPARAPLGEESMGKPLELGRSAAR